MQKSVAFLNTSDNKIKKIIDNKLPPKKCNKTIKYQDLNRQKFTRPLQKNILELYQRYRELN